MPCLPSGSGSLRKRSMERKFTRVLARPGMAAQLRENVSQAVKETTIQTQRHITEPLDYEGYVSKNMTILRNDPHRELLLFPLDDVEQHVREQHGSALGAPLEQLALQQADNHMIRECLETYTARLVSVKYKYDAYAATYLQLPRFPRTPPLPPYVCESDLDIDCTDSIEVQSVSKAGYLLRGTDGAGDKLFAKSFKRRFARLRQGVDGNYVLEFYKDSKSSESKGAIPLDLVSDVVKAPKRGKFCFELRSTDGGKGHVLTAETEADLQEWLDTVSRAVALTRDDRLSVTSETVSTTDGPGTPALGPPPADDRFSTLRGLDQSLNPQLNRYAHETDYLIGQARTEGRLPVFQLYPDIQSTPLSVASSEDHLRTEPFSEVHGVTVLVRCESLQFRLQMAVDETGDNMSQIEPYFASLCLYDAKQGRKISEDFFFDVNEPYIRNLLPKSISKNKSRGACLLPDLTHAPLEWLSYPRQALFTVQQPHSEIFLVARIEKVLQGAVSVSCDQYCRTADPKHVAKMHHQVRQSCDRLGGYRMPFAWTARPLFRSTADLDPADFGALYRHEPNRMTEDDVLKLLQDWRKPDKLSRLAVIPGSLKVTVQIHSGQTINNCLSPSLVPLKPFPVPPSCPPTLKLQSLPAPAPELAVPHTGYTNLLYVYPRRLKYDAQKTFKARNIACRVELRQGDDEHAAPLECFYARPGQGCSYTTSQLTSVLHHETTPSWGGEVKLALPLAVDERHHLLFTFYHVSCQPKPAKRGQETPDAVVGYSWIPLLSKGRLNLDTQTVAVAAHLPPGYLAVEPLGLGRGYAGPEIRWVDGQKPLFKVTFRLVSTIYTLDQHLHNFFLHAHRLRESRLPTVYNSDNETTKQVKALHAIDVATLIRFLPTLLNQLLRIVVSTDSDEVLQNTLRVLTHAITTLHQVGRQRLVDIYTRHVFSEPRPPPAAGRTVHEALCRGLAQLLQPSNMDFLLVHKLLRHASSLFDIIVKSMALHLLNSGRIKMQRHERFSASFNTQLETMLEAFYPYILQKYKELPIETREANRSMAALLKRCLSLMDRGFVFRLITSYLEKFSLADPRLLWEYKFEFLQMVCAHEHYIQLNLPIFSPARVTVRSLQDFEQQYFMSEQFSAKHYLTGLMLHELRLALSQISEVRRMAIHAVRDLLVKHAYDDRYQTKGQKSRIATLYFPLVGILLENLHRLDVAAPAAAAAAAGGGGGGAAPPSSAAVSRAASHRSTGTWQTSSSWVMADGTSSLGNRNRFSMTPDSSLNHSRATQRESTYLAYIAGQGQQASESTAASTVSLASTSSSQNTVESAHLENGENGVHRADEPAETDSQPGTAKRSTHNRTQSTVHDPGALYRYDKLLAGEARDLLVCFLHVVRHVPEELLITWWRHAAEEDVINFFTLVQLCLSQFRYTGGVVTRAAHPRTSETKKAFTLPARIESPGGPAAGLNNASFTESPAGKGPSPSPPSAPHLSSEAALVSLDLCCLYSAHYSERLTLRGGQNAQMALLSGVLLSLLHPGQAEAVLKHVFAALRMFVQRYGSALYHGTAELCGRLCYDLLRCCNSPLASSRHEACAVLYLLMRGNFEFTNRKAITRVHLQVIIKVSQLLGESVVLDSSHFYESLALINSYANSDKAMTRTSFVSDVKDLTKRVRTVLMATAQLKEHENDPAVLVELQHSLANSYASTPELRQTWLASMAKCHVRDGNLSEAAMCQVHIAALMAEYLLQRGEHETGCAAFRAISDNVVRDENNLRLDHGIGDLCYTEDSLVAQLKVCAEAMEACERHELIADIYDILIPIYRKRRSYSELSQVHHHLERCYNRIVQLNASGRRLLGTYFRVICLGQNYFDKDHDREYVYKEPKVTSLSEVSEKLLQLHVSKFGRDYVRMIKDSAPVVMSELDPRYAYIQVTHLTPHWDEVDLDARPTEFEHNNNIKQFMYETPFTREGGAHGTVEKQWRRRTVLTTDYCFPYVRTRIPVIRRQEYELSPIEVAIAEMTQKTRDLLDVVERQPTDVKKLQLRLQGSVSVQVNAGPLAYASAFLEESVQRTFPGDKVYQLKQAFREFVEACHRALELNHRLRADDQADYQSSLVAGFRDLVAALGTILGESFPVELESAARNSQHLSVYTLLSSVTGSSSV